MDRVSRRFLEDRKVRRALVESAKRHSGALQQKKKAKVKRVE